MSTIVVRPPVFTMVDFDAGVIASIAERLAGELGLAEVDIAVDVDEAVPLTSVRLVSADPISLWVEGGAFEDPKRPRRLGPDAVTSVLGRLLWQARDRRDPDFGAPPLDEKLSLAHRVAWDVYAMGHLDRLGHRAQRPRWQYAFRNRHGFTDVADLAFVRLWDADGLDWVGLTAISDDALAARVVG